MNSATLLFTLFLQAGSADFEGFVNDVTNIGDWRSTKMVGVGTMSVLDFQRPGKPERLTIDVMPIPDSESTEQGWRTITTPSGANLPNSTSPSGLLVGQQSICFRNTLFVRGGRTIVGVRFYGREHAPTLVRVEMETIARYALARLAKQPGTLAPSQTVRPTRVDRKRAFAEAVVNGRKLKFPLSSNFALDGTKQVPLTGFTTLDGDDWVLPKPRSR